MTDIDTPDTTPRTRRPLVARPPRESAETLTSAEAAHLLAVSPTTLQRWRSLGCGPAFHRIGPRCVRYRRDAVLAWLGAPVQSTADADALPTASVRLGAPRRADSST
jgi:predicted DNA-binding transcriptional regulator AlpA